jgi:hypothetical protein
MLVVFFVVKAGVDIEAIAPNKPLVHSTEFAFNWLWRVQ